MYEKCTRLIYDYNPGTLSSGLQEVLSEISCSPLSRLLPSKHESSRYHSGGLPVSGISILVIKDGMTLQQYIQYSLLSSSDTHTCTAVEMGYYSKPLLLEHARIDQLGDRSCFSQRRLSRPLW